MPFVHRGVILHKSYKHIWRQSQHNYAKYFTTAILFLCCVCQNMLRTRTDPLLSYAWPPPITNETMSAFELAIFDYTIASSVGKREVRIDTQQSHISAHKMDGLATLNSLLCCCILVVCCSTKSTRSHKVAAGQLQQLIYKIVWNNIQVPKFRLRECESIQLFLGIYL